MDLIDDRELARRRALDLYRVVDTLPEAAYDDIVRLAAVICEVPIALVSLIDRDRQWFKACVGLDVRETPRDEAVCDHVIRRPDALLEVPDLSSDPRFAHFPAVIGDEGLRFYAGMPLVTPGGAAIGTVCVVDRVPRSLSDEQRAALEALARLTINLLEGRQREHVLERASQLREASPATGAYSIALFELQRFDRVVDAIGERRTEQLLQRLDQALEDALPAGRADSVNRSTGHAEFIAVLHGDAAATLARMRQAVEAVAVEAGVQVLVGVAEALDAEEAQERVFLRADAALSVEKDRLTAH